MKLMRVHKPKVFQLEDCHKLLMNHRCIMIWDKIINEDENANNVLVGIMCFGPGWLIFSREINDCCTTIIDINHICKSDSIIVVLL